MRCVVSKGPSSQLVPTFRSLSITYDGAASLFTSPEKTAFICSMALPCRVSDEMSIHDSCSPQVFWAAANPPRKITVNALQSKAILGGTLALCVIRQVHTYQFHPEVLTVLET